MEREVDKNVKYKPQFTYYYDWTLDTLHNHLVFVLCNHTGLLKGIGQAKKHMVPWKTLTKIIHGLI